MSPTTSSPVIRRLRDDGRTATIHNATPAANDPRAHGRALNLGGERTVTLAELAELAVAANGGGSYRLVPFPEERKRIDIGDFAADFSAIRDLLEWRPTMTLEDGLARSLAYYRHHGALYW